MFYAKSIFFPLEQISYNLLATNSFFVITNVLLYEYKIVHTVPWKAVGVCVRVPAIVLDDDNFTKLITQA